MGFKTIPTFFLFYTGDTLNIGGRNPYMQLKCKILCCKFLTGMQVVLVYLQ